MEKNAKEKRKKQPLVTISIVLSTVDGDSGLGGQVVRPLVGLVERELGKDILPLLLRGWTRMFRR